MAAVLILFWGWLALTLSFLIFVALSKTRTLRAAWRSVAFALAALLSGVLVQALNALIWDRFYRGDLFVGLSLSAGLLVPLGFVLALPLFKRDSDPARARRAAIALAVALALLIAVWTLAEICL